MSISMFRAGKASYYSRVYNFFSPAPKADSLVDKVSELIKAIILAPVSAVKYSAGFVTSSLNKEKPKTTSEKLALAANSAVSRIKEAVEPFKDLAVKNKSTIVKVVIAAAIVTGAVYAYRSYNIDIEPPCLPEGPGALVKALGMGALGMGALGMVKLIKSGLKDPASASQGSLSGDPQVDSSGDPQVDSSGDPQVDSSGDPQVDSSNELDLEW